MACYMICMADITSQIKELYAKAAAKVERAEKALDAARSELADLEAALRVIESLTPTGSMEATKVRAADAMAERHANILHILPEGPENGLEPKELHSHFSIIYGSDLSLDTFRTTIWRMKDKAFRAEDGGEWIVKNTDGRYWKRHASPNDKWVSRHAPQDNGGRWAFQTDRSDGPPFEDEDDGEARF